MARTNFSPGQYRDLSKPLIEVDPSAPPEVQREQRFQGTVVHVIVWICVALVALMLLFGLIAFIAAL